MAAEQNSLHQRRDLTMPGFDLTVIWEMSDKTKAILFSASVALAVFTGSPPASAQSTISAGKLDCTLTVSVEPAVGARRSVPCDYQPVKHANADEFDLAKGNATVTVSLK